MGRLTRRAIELTIFVVVWMSVAAAAKHDNAPVSASLSALWVEPRDIESRDLLWGPGGRQKAPKEGDTYRFLSVDHTGHSDAYHVVGEDGRAWRVKIGNEVHSEIAVSRILWAIGYHQPATYYVKEWHLSGGEEPKPQPARFRLNSDHKTSGSWSFEHNPFLGSRELHGLIVVNLLLNNWDLGDSNNNRIYVVKSGDGDKQRWFVVQDVGGALGKSRFPIGTRSKIGDFESQGFVDGVSEGRVTFDYHGPHKKVLDGITPADVAWACGLLARLSDKQLSDAFTGAGYSEEEVRRYVGKVKEKIGQGLNLSSTANGTR